MERDALCEGVPVFGWSFVMSDSKDIFPRTFRRLGLDNFVPRLPGLIGQQVFVEFEGFLSFCRSGELRSL